MSERQLKPLSEAVRRNWELWCEASFAKRARIDLAGNREGFTGGLVVIGIVVGALVGQMTGSFAVALAIISVAALICAIVNVRLARQFKRLGVIPENVEGLRLGDIRAASLHELNVYMVELQKKLLDHPRWDVAYKVSGGEELLLEEHLARFAAQMEVLEGSFQNHGDLGTLLNPGQIEQLGTQAIAKIQATERDADAFRLAVSEVERSSRGTP